MGGGGCATLTGWEINHGSGPFFRPRSRYDLAQAFTCARTTGFGRGPLRGRGSGQVGLPSSMPATAPAEIVAAAQRFRPLAPRSEKLSGDWRKVDSQCGVSYLVYHDY